jgi:hypothetical protein
MTPEGVFSNQFSVFSELNAGGRTLVRLNTEH